MSKLLGTAILHVGTGGAPLELDRVLPAPPVARLYAFAMPLKGGIAKVFGYDETEAGLRDLANLIRGERVLAVVRGHKVNVEAATTVALEFNGQTIIDRVKLE